MPSGFEIVTRDRSLGEGPATDSTQARLGRRENRAPSRLQSPALFVAVAFALGIAGVGFSPEHIPAPSYFVSALIGSSAACLLAGAILVHARREVAAAFVVLSGFALAGASAAALFSFRFPPNHLSHLESWEIDLSRPVDLEGGVLSDPMRSPSGIEFDLEATELSQARDGLAASRSVTGKVRVTAAYTAALDSAGALGLQGGDRIRASMRLRQPRVYQNPGSFDFRRRAESIEDLYWEGSIDDARQLHKLPAGRQVSPNRFIEDVRGRLRAAIDRLYPPWSAEGRDGAVLKAILLGDRSSLDSATIDHFRASGLYHLLVIAGLHVGLIAALILALCRLLRLRRSARNLCLLAMLLAYAFVVEQRAPTLRATLMVVIFVLAELLGRDHTALNAVGVAALILLVTRPAWLFESGFQLSFAAALLIVGLAAPLLRATVEPYRASLRELGNIERDTALLPRQAQFRLDLRLLVSTLRGGSRMLNAHPEATRRLVAWPLYAGFWLAEAVLFSALLQVGLLLPMVQEFHRVALAGVGLNALALPLTAVLLAVSIPTVILAVFLPVWAAWPAKAVAVILRLLFTLASLPHLPAWLSYRVPSPPAWVAAGFAVSLIVVALTLGRSRLGLVAFSLSFAVFATLLVTAPSSPRLPGGALEVTALDCGRGEALYLVLPNRSTVLVGAGGAGRAGPPAFARAQRWDAGENIVSPYLWSRGVKQINVLVIGSAAGNLQGFVALLQNFRVDELWYAPNSVAEVSGGELQAIFDIARQRGTRIREVAAGEVLGLDTTEFRIQPALAGAWNRGESAAEPFVMQVTDPKGSAMITMGMNAEGLQRPETDKDFQSLLLATDGPGLAWAARSGLLRSVSPRLAIVAPGSSHGQMLTGSLADAMPEVAGLHTLETDVEGAVTVTMMPSSFEVRTFHRGDKKLP